MKQILIIEEDENGSLGLIAKDLTGEKVLFIVNTLLDGLSKDSGIKYNRILEILKDEEEGDK